MNQHSRWIIISLISLLVGFFANYFYTYNGQKIILQKIHPQNLAAFQFINPLLGVELTTKEGYIKELLPLKQRIEKIFRQKVQEHKINSISYYFFDLNTSRAAGFAENDQFDPASLLKVPVMMAYFKKAEINPNLLNAKITFENASNSPLLLEAQRDKSVLKPGSTYTVDELIKIMIEDSDNVAKALLLDILKKQPTLISWNDLNDIFSYLGINIKNNLDRDLIISSRTYSIYFRLLYNGNYLNYASSEKALKLLSAATFKEGLAAGVPKDISVANKFGFYSFDENGRPVPPELHDCGIIYHLKNPYLLCIMTKGDDPNDLREIIQAMSKITYDFVDKYL